MLEFSLRREKYEQMAVITPSVHDLSSQEVTFKSYGINVDFKEKCLWHKKAVEADNYESKSSAEVKQAQNSTINPQNPSKYSSIHALYGSL